jgi:hypothetical protein
MQAPTHASTHPCKHPTEESTQSQENQTEDSKRKTEKSHGAGTVKSSGTNGYWDWRGSSSAIQPTTAPTARAVSGISLAAALGSHQPQPELSMESAWQQLWQQLCDHANHGTNGQQKNSVPTVSKKHTVN